MGEPNKTPVGFGRVPSPTICMRPPMGAGGGDPIRFAAVLILVRPPFHDCLGLFKNILADFEIYRFLYMPLPPGRLASLD